MGSLGRRTDLRNLNVIKWVQNYTAKNIVSMFYTFLDPRIRGVEQKPLLYISWFSCLLLSHVDCNILHLVYKNETPHVRRGRGPDKHGVIAGAEPLDPLSIGARLFRKDLHATRAQGPDGKPRGKSEGLTMRTTQCHRQLIQLIAILGWFRAS